PATHQSVSISLFLSLEEDEARRRTRRRRGRNSDQRDEDNEIMATESDPSVFADDRNDEGWVHDEGWFATVIKSSWFSCSAGPSVGEKWSS
ncbi:unnamed protein product, partial [Linum tenue]